MTDYIEEMMRTAGVDYYDRYYNCKNDKEGICDTDCCFLCDESEEVYCYPDFTSAKQLEMIKLIGWASPKDIERENQDFTQTLAQLTTELMNAGELDKQKVKEILE